MADSRSVSGLVWRALMKAMGGIHRTLYRASGGRIGGRMLGMDVLILTTTGRRSGKARSVPLLFLPDGDDLVVVASNGGRDWPPAWWLNLQANAEASALVKRGRVSVLAREASTSERERLWPEVTKRYGGYAKYKARTSRAIPVVILSRQQSKTGSSS